MLKKLRKYLKKKRYLIISYLDKTIFPKLRERLDLLDTVESLKSDLHGCHKVIQEHLDTIEEITKNRELDSYAHKSAQRDLKKIRELYSLSSKKQSQFNMFLNNWAKEVRSGKVCDICGETSNIQAHHVWPKGKYPMLSLEIANGKPLCGKCHAEYHAAYNIDEVNPNTYEDFKKSFRK